MHWEPILRQVEVSVNFLGCRFARPKGDARVSWMDTVDEKPKMIPARDLARFVGQ